MMGIAVGGLAVNLLSLQLLHSGRAESLNLRGAWLHVLTDALGSIGTILAAALIWGLHWFWADPVTSILVGLLVIYSSWGLLAEAVSVLMESAPPGLDVDQIRDALSQVSGVAAVHDLHVWSITTQLTSLSVHLVTSGDRSADLLSSVRALLHARFGIDHVTVQLESSSDDPGCGSSCT